MEGIAAQSMEGRVAETQAVRSFLDVGEMALITLRVSQLLYCIVWRACVCVCVCVCGCGCVCVWGSTPNKIRKVLHTLT
jgi:hypothetical protein